VGRDLAREGNEIIREISWCIIFKMFFGNPDLVAITTVQHPPLFNIKEAI
jgi:hypothetical protein